jgi:hypothetical protein
VTIEEIREQLPEYTEEQFRRDRAVVMGGAQFSGSLIQQNITVLWKYANELMVTDRGMMSEEQLNALRMRATGIAGLTSRTELTNAICKHVHVHSLSSQPVKISRLNRIYGRVAFKLKTNVREIAEDLLYSGKLIPFEYQGQNALVSKAVWDALPSIIPGYDSALGTPEYVSTIASWAANTVK